MACDALPDHVWHNVLRFLPQDSIGRFGIVSHRCQSVVDTLLCTFPAFNTRIAYHLSNEHLVLLMQRWLRTRPQIQVLQLVNRNYLDDTDFGETEDGDRDDSHMFTPIHTLHVIKCERIRGPLLQRISNYCVNLQQLNLGHCSNMISPESIISLIRTAATQLQYVTLEGMIVVNDEMLEELGRNCPNIVMCNISECINVTNKGLRSLVSGCTKIERLSINRCHNLQIQAIRIIADTCTELTELSMIGYGGLVAGTNDMTYLAQQCNPKLDLKNIYLDACHSLSQDVLTHLMHRFTNIQFLGLDSTYVVSDTMLQTIASCLKQLQMLRINRCIGRITDVGVAAVVQKCPDLFGLGIGGCWNITHQTLDTIVEYRPNLQKLSLQGSMHIADEHLQRYLVQLTALEELSLRECKVSDETIDILAQSLKRLLRVNLHACKNVTDESMRSLATHLGKQLVEVNADRTRITKQHLSDFGIKCVISV